MLLGAVAFLSLSSCNKIKDAIASNIPDLTYEDNNVTINVPASSNTSQQTAFGYVQFDLNQYIKDHAGGSGIGFNNVKHVYVKEINAQVINGDANNNFQNLTFTTASSPVLVFNTTADYSTATVIGGGLTTPPADPYNLSLPVTNNADFLSHINGKDWAYGLAYKLAKPTTKDLQVKLTVKYTVSFKQ